MSFDMQVLDLYNLLQIDIAAILLIEMVVAVLNFDARDRTFFFLFAVKRKPSISSQCYFSTGGFHLAYAATHMTSLWGMENRTYDYTERTNSKRG